MSKSKKEVTIYTDGACSGNPGPGGWGALLIYRDIRRELSGFEAHTTNNRMELIAAVEALESLQEACIVALYTDSKYVQQGITSWINNWIKNGWRNAKNKPVLNQDLWQKLSTATQRHTVSWHWVKGHSNHPENERVDYLARMAIVQHQG